jgi:hypothetical protein
MTENPLASDPSNIPSELLVQLPPMPDQLTEDESESFRNLVMVGAISDTFEIAGHKVILHTLNVDEDLQVGVLLHKFTDTHAFPRAYKTLICAAAIISIDGEPLVTHFSLSEGKVTVQERFDKLKDFFPVVIDAIYERFVELEEKVTPVVSRLGKH